MPQRETTAWLLATVFLGSCSIEEIGSAPSVGGTGGGGGVVDSGWPDGSGGTVSGGAGGGGGFGGSGGASGGSGGATDGGDADVSVGGDAGVGGTGAVDAGDSGSGGTTAWQPKDIPNCLLWLDGADSTAVSLAGSTVQIWLDKCGGHAVTAAGNAKPSYLSALQNGLNGIRFDGVDDTLEIGGTAKSAAAYVMFFAAANSNGSASQFPIWSNRHIPPAVGSTQTYFGLASQRLFLFQNNAPLPALTGTFALATSPHLIELAVSASGRQFVIDGLLDSVDSVVVSTATGLPAGFLAYDNLNNAFGGFDVFEVVVYDRDLSMFERATVRSALKAKWALP